MFGPMDDQTYSLSYSLPEYDRYLDRFLQNLWRKYGRVSLINGRGNLYPYQIYDEVRNLYIPREQFDPDQYSILALRRLRNQIENIPGYEMLYEFLDRKIKEALRS